MWSIRGMGSLYVIGILVVLLGVVFFVCGLIGNYFDWQSRSMERGYFGFLGCLIVACVLFIVGILVKVI